MYERLTGRRWPHRGWIAHPDSLRAPIPVTPGPLLPLFMIHQGRAHSHTVVLSGRVESLRPQIMDVFAWHDVRPDEVILKEAFDADTVVHKLAAMRRLIERFPRLQHVWVWDDDKENLVAFARFESELGRLPGRHIQMRVVNSVTVATKLLTQQRTFSDRLLQNCVLRHGLLRSNAFSSAADEGLQLLHVTWQQVLAARGIATPAVSSTLVLPLGSYELARVSDVDLCLLGASPMNHWDCIQALEQALRQRGVAFVYTAAHAVCPRLRMRLFFARMRPIEYDVLFVILPQKELAQVPAALTERLSFVQRHAVDATSRESLQGCEFLRHVRDTLEQANIKVAALAVTVEMLKTMLQMRGLMGSTYHAVRTFQVILLVLRFMPPAKATFSAEEWLAEVVARSAELTLDQWHGLLNRDKFVVAAQWLKPVSETMRWAHALLSRHGVTDEALAQLLLPEAGAAVAVEDGGALRVEMTCRGPNAALCWQLETLLGGRMAAFFGRLMDAGCTVRPCTGHSDAVLAFWVRRADGCGGTVAHEMVVQHLQPLWSELDAYRRAGITMRITADAHVVLFDSCESAASVAADLAAAGCQQYLDMVSAFAADPTRTELVLPATLTTAQRRVVHQRADDLGLQHTSSGTGRERHIVVARK